MTRIREIALMLLTAVIILFAVQNLDPVTVDFLAWELQVPLALITLVPMLAGLLIGITAAMITLRKRRRAAEHEEAAELAEEEEAGESEEAEQS